MLDDLPSILLVICADLILAVAQLLTLSSRRLLTWSEFLTERASRLLHRAKR
jgi:hypothetical protein